MLIVGVGGTLRPGSSTERVLLHVLRQTQALGAETSLFVGESINLPMYIPHQSTQCAGARSLISALRQADAIVIGSPGYHGGISGLVKNALDYTVYIAKYEAPYFEERAVGVIA